MPSPVKSYGLKGKDMGASWDYYHVFYHVAKHENITAAAEELFLSQSTVSRTIQKLESELGVTLLLRSNKGITLTQEGKLLAHHLDVAYRNIDTAEHKIRQLKTLGYGNLHIGITEMTIKFFLLPYLEQFKREYPDIHISLSYEYPGTIKEPLHNGSMDFAVITTPLPEDDTLKYTPLLDFQDILVAGPDYFDLAEQPHTLQELAGYPFILMEEGTSARDYINRFFEQNGLIATSEYNLSSMPIILDMIKRNLGIGFIPDLYVTKEFFDDEVRRIYLKNPLPARQFCLVTSKEYPQVIAAKKFIEYIL